MRRSGKTAVVVAALFAVSSVTGILLHPPKASAQDPVEVALIGKILTPKEKGEASTYTLDLEHKALRFRVDQGITPDYSMEDTTIYDILGMLESKSIRVIGPKNATHALLQPGDDGKYFFIEGDLYTEPKLLVITEAKQVGKRADEGPSIEGGRSVHGM